MKVIVETNRYAQPWVEAICDWVASAMRCRSFVRKVIVQDEREGLLGECTSSGIVYVYMPNADGWLMSPATNGSIEVEASDWREVLVSILAHEFSHAVQWKRGMDKQSAWRNEMEAEAWAWFALTTWRLEHAASEYQGAWGTEEDDDELA